MDGILIDSEHIWDVVREAYVAEIGGTWTAQAQRAMMGMSSLEWPRYMHEELGVPRTPVEIDRDVVERIRALYEKGLPLIPGAREAVEALAARWPLAVASSSNRSIIDHVLESSGLARWFRTVVSSEEVPRGKPAPDVYLRAAELLGADPKRSAGVEDSHNGILAAASAGLRVIAIPNKVYPPGAAALDRAAVVLDSIEQLTPKIVEAG